MIMATIMDSITSAGLESNPYVVGAMTVISVASVIVAATPTPKSKKLRILYKVIEVLAINIGKAKQK